MQQRVLGDGITIVGIPYSEYVTCVEVLYRGHSMAVFCSDKDYVNECFVEENSESIFRILGSFLRTASASAKGKA